MNLQAVLDGRTSHQSVVSRLIREQREGLRDSRGALLAEHPGSPRQHSGVDRGSTSSSDVGDGGGGGGGGSGDAEARATVEELVWEGESGTTAAAEPSAAAAAASTTNGAAPAEAGPPRRGGEGPEEDRVDGEHENAEGVGDGSSSGSYGETFSFLSSGFDEATLGGMRTPTFLLPRVIISEGYVQVIARSSSAQLRSKNPTCSHDVFAS